MSESALVVLVPEAEELVGPFRAIYDPVANCGMPAHITILYPFKKPEAIDASVTRKLEAFFECHDPFAYALATIAQFPGVVYLAPDNVSPFVDLMTGIAEEFPENPPYGGTIKEVVPHLTVGHSENEAVFEKLKAEFTVVAKRELPIASRVDEVWLMEEHEGRWRGRIPFPLGTRGR